MRVGLSLVRVYYKPADGNERLMTFVNEDGTEKRARVLRDLSAEKKNAAHFIKQCPNLKRYKTRIIWNMKSKVWRRL